MKTKWTVSRCMTAVLCLSALMGGCICYPEGEIQSLIWETEGGGNILFGITRDDDRYRIHVTRYQGSETDTEITLSEEDGDTYFLVDDIFEKRRNLCNDTFIPRGETGTWTTINLFSENDQVVIKNIEAWGELRIIPEFVEQELPARTT